MRSFLRRIGHHFQAVDALVGAIGFNDGPDEELAPLDQDDIQQGANMDPVRGRGRDGRGRNGRYPVAGQRGRQGRGQGSSPTRGRQRGGRRGRGNRPVAVGEQQLNEQVAPLQPPDVEPVAVGEQQLNEQAAPLQPPDVEDTNGNSCVVCLVNARALVAVPCGHYSFCATCATEMHTRAMRCAVCRLPVTFYMPVYNM